MNKFTYQSFMKATINSIDSEQQKQKKKSAKYLKGKIKQKTNSRKKTGNLSKGVYMKNTKKGDSYVGIRAPGHQAYILEFGQGRLKKPAPSVYNTFAEEAGKVEAIMSEPIL